MNLKRDNWTNAEVIQLLEGCKLVNHPPMPEWSRHYNEGIDACIDFFRGHFACDERAYGALALDTDAGGIIHVGPKLPQ